MVVSLKIRRKMYTRFGEGVCGESKARGTCSDFRHAPDLTVRPYPRLIVEGVGGELVAERKTILASGSAIGEKLPP